MTQSQPFTSSIVVAGGGTAGHVFPAIAVMQGLVDAGVDPAQLKYVGAQRGIETELVPESGFSGTFFSVSGIGRKFSLQTPTFVARQIAAAIRSILLFRRWKVGVVVSVGGYASLPPVLAAIVLRRPIVVISYDRTPGRASRLAARWASSSAVAFEGSPLPNAVVVGAPLRRSILEVDRQQDSVEARRRLGVPEGRDLIVVMGGSLGSGVLNDAVASFLEVNSARNDLAVLHISGKQRVAGPSERNGDDSIWYRRSEFVRAAEELYAAADLFVGRGGASTVHEVAATGTPAILVPWSGASDDHQLANVRWLSDSFGAVLVGDNDPNEVVEAITTLLEDVEKRDALSARAREIGAIHHGGLISKLVLESLALHDTK
ncbi:MAG: UDP-N-acetylglucosamine--N-acetylmuramyl-(pentapeptide) pyrophosphoryl-undecaprenol N-acetylglucosamine transferase [Ilumatobacteraceae bacterium]|nr:UDP-N-acetylglucosamine--N-acetylmuramyl-(pentapeptide) pyrophosphoryl-undecaprenol N-acetylglucosamine transferase [Actinomycetota bacterium]